MSQWRPSGRRTGSFVNRWTSVSSSSVGATRPTITRPLDAPRSTAATSRPVTGGSPEEGRRDARVDGDVEPRRLTQVATDQGEDRGRDVLGQDLALEQRPLRVELAELVLRDPVGPSPIRAPALGEDAGAADDAVRIDAVDPDAVLAEFR